MPVKETETRMLRIYATLLPRATITQLDQMANHIGALCGLRPDNQRAALKAIIEGELHRRKEVPWYTIPSFNVKQPRTEVTPAQKEAISYCIDLISRRSPLLEGHVAHIDALRELLNEKKQPERRTFSADELRAALTDHAVAVVLPVVGSGTLDLQGQPGVTVGLPPNE